MFFFKIKVELSKLQINQVRKPSSFSTYFKIIENNKI